MLGNFSYHNPTKLYFGDDALRYLNEELPKYGKTVQLIYGGGSIKKNGLYDEIIAILKANGKTVVEDAGVMPNPTVDKLREGGARTRSISSLRSAAGRAVTTRRRYPYPSTVTTIPGTNTISALRNPTARSFPWDVC